MCNTPQTDTGRAIATEEQLDQAERDAIVAMRRLYVIMTEATLAVRICNQIDPQLMPNSLKNAIRIFNQHQDLTVLREMADALK